MAEFIDHTPELEKQMEKAMQAALEAVGGQCVSHVVQILTADAYQHSVSWYARTGALKKFTHELHMDEKAVYVGSDLNYAPYWEYGTGEYGGGRPGYWVFVPGGGGGGPGGGKIYTLEQAKQVMAILQSKGIDAHITKGIKPVHMLQRAVEDYSDEYKAIMEQYLGSGMK